MTVVAIIGILVSLTGYVYSSSLSRTRDTQRLSDLRVIQGALEQFYTANRYYPPYKKNVGNLFLTKFQFEDFKVLAGCDYIDYDSVKNDFLVPRFLNEIPEDPHFKFGFNVEAGSNNCLANPNQRHQYLYIPNDFLSPNIEPIRPSGFYLIAHMERVSNISDKVPELGFWGSAVESLGINFCDKNNHGPDCSHNFYLANSRND